MVLEKQGIFQNQTCILLVKYGHITILKSLSSGPTRRTKSFKIDEKKIKHAHTKKSKKVVESMVICNRTNPSSRKEFKRKEKKI